MGTDSRHREREKRILKMWEEDRTFEKSVKNREGSEPFVFYEGPPTANGLPHAGHALGRTIKDLVPRYQTMRGRQVIRKAGWDTHGLPVELGVEKALGISGKQEIEAYGIEAFVGKCRESVFEYEKQWRTFTRELGYWVDMDHPYVTMDNDYIESVWHILGTIHDKGLLYKGHRVSPYCTSCQTSLSSHETAQGYKDVKDLSVTAKFKLTGRENEYVLGWTTTPWTLPANTALAVNGQLDYVRVRSGEEIYIAAQSRLSFLEGRFEEVLDVFKGSELAGLQYEPPFFQADAKEGYKIAEANFVTDSSGTGIVHIAPAYGEEDYQLAQEQGLPFIHVIDGAGKYLPGTGLLAGKPAKESDLTIIRMLQEKNLLFSKKKYEHSYPHCWRCSTPLIYFAAESWFIRMTALKEELASANGMVNWHPEHLREGRFGHFLENLVDWNISRSRYWGTPLNVWVCGQCGREAVPKSRSELESWSGRDLADLDLHKPQTDAVTFECPSCSGTMRRVPEVIDVWFDSGAMPFAQYHYPFEDSALFKQQFPADAVIEGIDQTRGWFYSLLAVSMIYTGKVPYKHVLATGHVLDENGLKMSKSKGNALDPSSLIHEFGADALRWALVHDSAPWNPKRFSKQNVLEARSKMVDTLASIHRFYMLYTEMDGWTPKSGDHQPNALMDRWILSRLSGVNAAMKEDLDHFRLTEAARTGAAFVEDVSNWYIRRCRNRFWQEGMNADKEAAYQTLYTVLKELSKLLAPFIPFITEDIHMALAESSVHLADYPDLPKEWMDPGLDRDMDAVREMCELGRRIRHTAKLKIKQPLARMIILPFQGEPPLSDELLSILKEELNVKKAEWEDKASEWICLSAKLNFKTAGSRLGHLANKTNEVLDKLSSEGRLDLNAGESFMVSVDGENIELTENDILVKRSVSRPGYAEASGRRFSVILELTLNEDLRREGTARDFIRLVQDLRKQLDLPVDKRIRLEVGCSAYMRRLLEDHTALLMEGILIKEMSFTDHPGGKELSLGSEKIYVAVS